MLSQSAMLAQELHDAASAGQAQRLRELLPGLGGEGAEWLRGALIRAVYENEVRTSHSLLEAGAPVDSLDDLGHTPLHWAARRGYETMARLLLERSAKVGLQNQDGTTPLHLAVENNSGPIVKMLLQRRADPSVRANDKRTALHMAAECNSTLAVAVLLEGKLEGRNAGRVEGTGKGDPPSGPGGHPVLVPSPLLELENNRGDTPLARAAARGNAAIVQLLLRADADPEHRNLWGQAALQLAALHNHVGSAAVLLDAGASVNAAAQDGTTPLHSAVDRGNCQVVELLLSHGGNAMARALRGRTPLHAAAERGCLEAAEALLASGAKVDVCTDEGRTPLSCAASRGHVELAERLLAAEADPLAMDMLKQTPLHAAAAAGRVEVAELLIRRGVHLEQQDAAGRTAIMLALNFKQDAMVRLLVKRRAVLPEDVAKSPDMQPLIREAENEMLQEQLKETSSGRGKEQIKAVEKEFEAARMELVRLTILTSGSDTVPATHHAEMQLAAASELVRIRKLAEKSLAEQLKVTVRAVMDAKAEVKAKKEQREGWQKTMKELEASFEPKRQETARMAKEAAEAMERHARNLERKAELLAQTETQRQKAKEQKVALAGLEEDSDRLEAELATVREQLAKWNAEKDEAARLHAQAQAILNRNVDMTGTRGPRPATRAGGPT